MALRHTVKWVQFDLSPKQYAAALAYWAGHHPSGHRLLDTQMLENELQEAIDWSLRKAGMQALADIPNPRGIDPHQLAGAAIDQLVYVVQEWAGELGGTRRKTVGQR
jgi:hypothetical protein